MHKSYLLMRRMVEPYFFSKHYMDTIFHKACSRIVVKNYLKSEVREDYVTART